MAEELDLHLLELAGAKRELARRYLVAERLSDLGNTKRDLLAACRLCIRKIHEDALGGFGSEVPHYER